VYFSIKYDSAHGNLAEINNDNVLAVKNPANLLAVINPDNLLPYLFIPQSCSFLIMVDGALFQSCKTSTKSLSNVGNLLCLFYKTMERLS